MGARVSGKYGTNITVRGRLFDNLPGELGLLGDAISRDLADHTMSLVHAQLKQNLRHPTGYYQGHIRTTTVQDTLVVDDSRVIYGPWLEGTGSRNKTTRFKGYRSFRSAAQQANKDARGRAQAVVDKWVAGVNR